MQGDFINVACCLPNSCLWIRCPANYRQGRADDEQYQIQKVHDGGENGTTFELIR